MASPPAPRRAPSGRTERTKRSELGQRLRQLPEEQQLVLSERHLRALVTDAQEVTVAAFVSRLAYESHCNYLMVAAQAVFTKRPRSRG
jgi:hypothetical protein